MPALTESEQDRFDHISGNLKRGQFYTVKDIIRSKVFLRSFALESGNMTSSGGHNTEEKNASEEAHFVADEGEPHHSQCDPPRDDSVEYVGTIRKRQRKILPFLPDQVLLLILGAKIWPSYLYWGSYSSSSSSEIWSDSHLPPELRPVGIVFPL